MFSHRARVRLWGSSEYSIAGGKLKYEKSLHAHRFRAERHIRKHPSVFLNVIDGENISGALARDFIFSRVFPRLFQRPYILSLKQRRELLDEKKTPRQKAQADDVCVFGKGSGSYRQTPRALLTQATCIYIGLLISYY